MPIPSRRLFLPALTLFLAGLLGYRAHSQVVGFRHLTPFVVYKHEAQYTENSKFPPYLFDSVYARRSDGSWAHHFTARTPAGDQTTGEMIEFVDFRTQNQTILEPFTRSAVIFHLSEREARWERGRVTDCSAVPEVSGGSVDASRFRMLSYTVARVAKKEDGLTLDNWVAPALDCYPIEETEAFASGSRNTRSVYKVEMGEPAEAFFEIPPEYIPRSPQQLEAEYKFKFGVPFWGEPGVSNAQRRYEHGLVQVE